MHRLVEDRIRRLTYVDGVPIPDIACVWYQQTPLVLYLYCRKLLFAQHASFITGRFERKD